MHRNLCLSSLSTVTFYFFSEIFNTCARPHPLPFAVMLCPAAYYFRSHARRSFEKIERLWTDYCPSRHPVHLHSPLPDGLTVNVPFRRVKFASCTGGFRGLSWGDWVGSITSCFMRPRSSAQTTAGYRRLDHWSALLQVFKIYTSTSS